MQKRILLDLSLTITIRTAIEYLLEADLILEHTVYCQFLKICCNESKIFFCDQGRTNMKTKLVSATSLPKQLFAASKIVGIPKAKIPEAISFQIRKARKQGSKIGCTTMADDLSLLKMISSQLSLLNLAPKSFLI